MLLEIYLVCGQLLALVGLACLPFCIHEHFMMRRPIRNSKKD